MLIFSKRFNGCSWYYLFRSCCTTSEGTGSSSVSYSDQTSWSNLLAVLEPVLLVPQIIDYHYYKSKYSSSRTCLIVFRTLSHDESIKKILVNNSIQYLPPKTEIEHAPDIRLRIPDTWWWIIENCYTSSQQIIKWTCAPIYNR